jgi:hypothetical protein
MQQRAIRLIGSLAPLLGGQAYAAVQKVDDRWLYRRSFPLSNFHDACVLCHANFGPENPAQWVGALVMAVPIRSSDD